MALAWPAVSYERWSATCDTLHAHTQVLGKLAVAMAPAEPQLQHAALRLTARGWETAPLPAPDGSGALGVALDLRTHEAVVEHSDGRVQRVALAPDRRVGDVTREVLGAVRGLGGAIEIDPTPQEVPWSVPLDEDREHSVYDPAQVADYFAAATQAALVLAATGTWAVLAADAIRRPKLGHGTLDHARLRRITRRLIPARGNQELRARNGRGKQCPLAGLPELVTRAGKNPANTGWLRPTVTTAMLLLSNLTRGGQYERPGPGERGLLP